MSGEVGGFFAQTYAEARSKFLASAAARGLEVESHPHPLAGRDGEALAMDVARDGPMDAAALLIVSSGCHGVEGYCGSGVQNALLADGAWHRLLESSGVATLYVHALNPYGFSHWRRTTDENVDLNRNFRDFATPPPRNPGYDELADSIVPERWPPDAETVARVGRFVAERGEKALHAAVSSGQYHHPKGLFYGGDAPTWSQRTLREVLRQHGARCTKLAWIDLHTGLGPNGHGERIFACRDDADAYGRARAWWGDVTSIYDGSSSSALLTGMMWLAAYEECAQSEYTGIALEYGTKPQLEVIDALRADQWLQNHPDADAATRRAIKRQVRDAFYDDSDAWKAAIVEQGVDAARDAVYGLSSTAA